VILEVRVFSGLEKQISGAKYGEPMEVDAPEGTSIYDLMRILDISEEMVFAILVNGIHANKGDILNSGDRVAFFPPVGGG